jgi:hypothetical protein
MGSLKIDLIVPAGSFEEVRTGHGVTFQPMCASGPQPCSERRAGLLRLTIDFLAPGQKLTTTLLLNRDLPATTGVSVALQSETDQLYTAHNEIPIEAGVK